MWIGSEHTSTTLTIHWRVSHHLPLIGSRAWDSYKVGSVASFEFILVAAHHHGTSLGCTYKMSWSPRNGAWRRFWVTWGSHLQSPLTVGGSGLVDKPQFVSNCCDPMNHSPAGSPVHGISQVKILEWVAISFSRGSSWPRDWIQISCIEDVFFTDWATREDWT